MTLTAEQRSVMNGIERELTEFIEDNLIGRPADHRSLRTVIEAAQERFWRVGARPLQVAARYVWSCPAHEPEPAPEGVDCPHFIEELGSWRRNPIRRFRLRFFHSPERCPLHRERLQRIMRVDSSVVLPQPVQMIVQRVVVG